MRRERPAVARLVLVTPVFNESANLSAYVDAVTRTVFCAPGVDARVIFVDDGSTDESWAAIEAAAARSPRFSGVRLSRNFGAHVALTAGFDQVGDVADAVATLAADLQDPPETVVQFVDAWRKGADIVWGSRRLRDDQGWRRLASSIMDGVLRRYAMPSNSKFRTGSFLLMDRKVLDCFLQYREQSRVTFALVAWTGFEQANVVYDRQARRAGHSGWSFGRMLNTAYDVFIGFSPVPAKVVTTMGFAISALSIVAILLMIAQWLVRDIQPGWTGLMVTVTFFFGILFMMIGMLAEYLYRIFIETKNRPLYFVADRVAGCPGSEPKDG